MDAKVSAIVASHVKKKHGLLHRQICDSIVMLTKTEQERKRTAGMYGANLSMKEQTQMARLIGSKCNINCNLESVPTVALLDTGAQVCMINVNQLKKEYKAEIQSLSTILDEPDHLEVQWGSRQSIPFVGWANMTFTVREEEDCAEIQVPFLVTTEEIPNPIIGFNVVRALMVSGNEQSVIKLLKAALDKDTETAQSIYNIMIKEPEEVIPVRVKGNNINIPAGRMVMVPCKANVGNLSETRPMMYQQLDVVLPEHLEVSEAIVTIKSGLNNYFKVPVINTSKHDIVLLTNREIGFVEPITSIVPLDVKEV